MFYKRRIENLEQDVRCMQEEKRDKEHDKAIKIRKIKNFFRKLAEGVFIGLGMCLLIGLVAGGFWCFMEGYVILGSVGAATFILTLTTLCAFNGGK